MVTKKRDLCDAACKVHGCSGLGMEGNLPGLEHDMSTTSPLGSLKMQLTVIARLNVLFVIR